MATAPPRHGGTSKVDDAERLLREWLAPGRFRPDDRLPPEHDLAAMLGISRGTLRAALARLEAAGVIRRRRGSGTFVAPPTGAAPGGFSAGLEVLESYSLLAERGAMRIGSESIVTRRGVVPRRAAEALGLPGGTSAVIIERVLLLEGRPAAWMQDILRPGVDLPPLDALRDHVGAGRMVMDVLRAHGVPVAYARTEIATRMVTARQRPGTALGLTAPTAMLELVETMHQADHTPVQWSLNLFRPGRLQLHVMRALPPEPPPHLGHGTAG